MKPLYHTAIYVNSRPSSLVKASHGDEPSDRLRERKAWTTGADILRKAEAVGCELPLIFGYYAPLEHWAVAREITVLGRATTYRFANLQKIPKGYRRKDLVVANSRKPLADNFIRSYAIVQTPDFLYLKNETISI